MSYSKLHDAMSLLAKLSSFRYEQWHAQGVTVPHKLEAQSYLQLIFSESTSRELFFEISVIWGLRELLEHLKKVLTDSRECRTLHQ